MVPVQLVYHCEHDFFAQRNRRCNSEGVGDLVKAENVKYRKKQSTTTPNQPSQTKKKKKPRQTSNQERKPTQAKTTQRPPARPSQAKPSPPYKTNSEPNLPARPPQAPIPTGRGRLPPLPGIIIQEHLTTWLSRAQKDPSRQPTIFSSTTTAPSILPSILLIPIKPARPTRSIQQPTTAAAAAATPPRALPNPVTDNILAMHAAVLRPRTPATVVVSIIL